MSKFPVLFGVAIFASTLFAKGESTLYFRCTETYTQSYGRTLQLDSNTATVSTVKFYIQHISISRRNNWIWQSTTTHLIDLSESDQIAISIPFDIKSGDSLLFTLGIDSATCVSGVQSGDLDPTSGMYWTWRSGYINMKIEGTSPLSKARNHEFQYHLGGYEHPYPAVQEVGLPIMKDSISTVFFSLNEFLRQTDLPTTDHIMSPGASAAKLSKAAASSFYVERP